MEYLWSRSRITTATRRTKPP